MLEALLEDAGDELREVYRFEQAFFSVSSLP